jgi:shikimate dehydrogenase
VSGPALPGALVLLGHPVEHSLSPAFQNAALAAAGVPLRYAAADVEPEQLGDTLEALRRLRAAGNVTTPHKVAVHQACEELTDVARRVGAVNTFKVDHAERLCGHNTDVGGVDAAVRKLVADPSGSVVAILGAGGAAAAALAAAEVWGVEIRIWSRRTDRAAALARHASMAKPVETVEDAVSWADIVINATSVGMTGDEMPCDPSAVSPSATVLDLVYRPHETAWVRALRSRDVNAADGLEMLLEQGALAFEWWLGIVPARGVMRAALPSR